VLVPEVDHVFSSGFARAWQTAELLHEVSRWPEAEECPALEAGRAPAPVLDVLRESTAETVALVGHEPFLSRLTSLLCASAESALRMKLKKGGVVSIEIATDLRAGTGCLLWSVTPKQLRAVSR
jgi:phosphohistidine phosphatase